MWVSGENSVQFWTSNGGTTGVAPFVEVSLLRPTTMVDLRLVCVGRKVQRDYGC